MTVDNSSEMINEVRGTQSFPGVCIICPWHCATEVFVKDDKVVYVRGNENSANGSTRCVKGVASIHLSRDPDRLLHPLKKNSQGEFESISWDQAFAEIAEKLAVIKEKYGPEAVFYLYHLDSNDMFSHQLFTQLYGTPNWSGHGAACDQDRRVAAMSTFGHPLPTKDFANSRFVMLWGCDPFGPNEALHENRELVEAMKKGCKLVIVDPNRSRTAEKADVWVPIKPGTDGAMALAMAHRIVETEAYDREFCEQWVYGWKRFCAHVVEKGYTPEWAETISGVPKETIIGLADEFATTKPGIMDGLKGLVNYTNGMDAFRAIYALNAITGNVDGPGNMILKEIAPLELPVEIPEEFEVEPEELTLGQAGGYPMSPDMPTQLLPKAVLEGDPYPIKGGFFHICNLAMSDPNPKAFKEMMAGLDLSVTIDMYLSETAQLSDYVLPECSMFERAEIREGMWSGPQAVVAVPAIKPLGDSRPLYEIMAGLAEKMGYGQYYQWDSWEDWAKRVLANIPAELEDLKKTGIWQGELRYHKFKSEPLATMSEKIEVFSDMAEFAGLNPMPEYSEESRVKPDEEYPFQLVNAKMQYHCNLHTQNNPYLMGIEDENWVELNPADAERLGIGDEDRVEVASPLDKVIIKARVRDGVQPGVLKVIHGHGFGRTMGSVARGKGTHVNVIFETRINPGSGGNSYNEHKVNVRKL